MDDAYKNPLGFQKGIDPEPQQNNELWQAELLARFNSIMHTAQTYSTPAGKAELERLRKNTIESSAWSPALAAQAGIEAANAHAYAREGQNALVRDIELRLEVAKKIKTPEELNDLLYGGNKNV